eukprot:scaffold55248_cov65-Attheya_sp.AAC.5
MVKVATSRNLFGPVAGGLQETTSTSGEEAFEHEVPGLLFQLKSEKQPPIKFHIVVPFKTIKQSTLRFM